MSKKSLPGPLLILIHIKLHLSQRLAKICTSKVPKNAILAVFCLVAPLKHVKTYNYEIYFGLSHLFLEGLCCNKYFNP